MTRRVVETPAVGRGPLALGLVATAGVAAVVLSDGPLSGPLAPAVLSLQAPLVVAAVGGVAAGVHTVRTGDVRPLVGGAAAVVACSLVAGAGTALAVGGVPVPAPVWSVVTLAVAGAAFLGGHRAADRY